MKKIFLCVLAVMMAVRVCALELEHIKPQLSKDLNTALEILARNASIEQKSNELFKLFDVYFDYKLMSALALGKIYKSLDNAQKAQFQEKFKERLKFSLSEKLSFYTDEKITITGDERPNEKRYFLHTQITSQNGEAYKLSFKFHRNGQNDYLVYDVDILGVSLIQTYKAQFEDLGLRADFNTILSRLNAMNELDKKEPKPTNNK